MSIRNKYRLYRTKKRLASFLDGIRTVTDVILTNTNLQNMANSCRDIKHPDEWHVFFAQSADAPFNFDEFFKNKRTKQLLNLCLIRYIESFLSLRDLTNDTIRQLRGKLKEINAKKIH